MQKKTLGYFLILLSAVIFSTVELSLKSVSGRFAPLQLTAIRFLGGGLFLTPFALGKLKKNHKKLRFGDLAYFGLLGLLFVILAMVIHQMAIHRAPAASVAVLFSCNALFATLLAGLFLKEPLGANHFVALTFEVAAVVVIIRPWEQQLDISGVLLALAAALAYGIYVVAAKKRSARYGGLVTTWGAVLFGAFGLILLILLGNIPAVSDLLQKMGLSLLAQVPLIPSITADMIPVLLYICIIVTATGNMFHIMAVEMTSAREAAVVFFLKPMLAPLLAWLFLGEEISLTMAIGIFLFLIGSASALWGDRFLKKR